MQTDADGNMVFRSSKGKLYYSFLVIWYLISAILLAVGINRILTDTGRPPWIFFLIGIILFFTGLLLILMNRYIKYVFEMNGIRFPHGDLIASGGLKAIPEFIPYSSIINFYETHRVTGITLGLSLDQVWIEYISEYGKKTGLGLSPKDKLQFISELTKRTGILPSKDPWAKK